MPSQCGRWHNARRMPRFRIQEDAFPEGLRLCGRGCDVRPFLVHPDKLPECIAQGGRARPDGLLQSALRSLGPTLRHAGERGLYFLAGLK
jgi:hypothetical protein